MFKLLTLPYIQAAITLPTTLYILTQFAYGQAVRAGTYVAIIIMAAHAILLLLTYLIMGTSVRIVVPWESIGKYIFASMVTAAILYVLPRPSTLTLTFATVIAGAAVYAVLLLAIDKNARMLVRSIMQEIAKQEANRAQSGKHRKMKFDTRLKPFEHKLFDVGKQRFTSKSYMKKAC